MTDQAPLEQELHAAVARRRQPPAGRRRRPGQRRRVRPHDGLRLRLRLVVVLRLAPPRRRRGRRRRAVDDPDVGRQAGAGRVHARHLRRPPRLDDVRRRLRGPALRLRAPRAVPQHPQPDRAAARSATSARRRSPRDIANLKAALDAAGIDGGLDELGRARRAARASPTSTTQTDEELLYACADAMREEYDAIVDAGLILQLDDPAIAENWDQIAREPSVEAYRRFTMPRIDALNHAIRGLPAGPHPLPPLLGQLARAARHRPADGRHRRRRCSRSTPTHYSFEAANVRHEHEWRVWQDVKLPEGKVILPGVVSHSHQRRRAPRARRRPDRALRRGGRPRARHRLDRLRPRRARAPADRLGQAGGARAGRRARDQASVELIASNLRELLGVNRWPAGPGGDSAWSMTSTMIAVDGGTVWADDSGGDGPPLVLLHPGVGDSRIWEPVLAPLTAGYRVIRYDARGFGNSPPPPSSSRCSRSGGGARPLRRAACGDRGVQPGRRGRARAGARAAGAGVGACAAVPGHPGIPDDRRGRGRDGRA